MVVELLKDSKPGNGKVPLPVYFIWMISKFKIKMFYLSVNNKFIVSTQVHLSFRYSPKSGETGMTNSFYHNELSRYNLIIINPGNNIFERDIKKIGLTRHGKFAYSEEFSWLKSLQKVATI